MRNDQVQILECSPLLYYSCKKRPILSLQHFYDLSDEQISWWIKQECIKWYTIITIFCERWNRCREKKKPMFKNRKYKMKLPFFGLLWDAFGAECLLRATRQKFWIFLFVYIFPLNEILHVRRLLFLVCTQLNSIPKRGYQKSGSQQNHPD